MKLYEHTKIKTQISKRVFPVTKGALLTPLTLLLVYSFVLNSALFLTVNASDRPVPEHVDEASQTSGDGPEYYPAGYRVADPIVVFGPETFERTDFQTRHVRRFSLPKDVVGPYTITIDNGTEDGNERILDGVIYLNDIVVAGSSELNLQSTTISRTVQLYSTNVLDVSFLGRGGASVTVVITGFRLFSSFYPPVIDSFSPAIGAVGTAVTILGSNLVPRNQTENNTVTVTFEGSNGTRRAATVTSATTSTVKVIVPSGIVSGPIELINANGRAISSASFNVVSELDYQITVMPSSVSAVQLTRATQIVAISSSHPSFTQLVSLSVVGLPSGVSSTFEPDAITAGATSNFTLNLANANLNPGSYSYSIKGTSEIDGRIVEHTAPAQLTVVAAGQTNVTGRVLSSDQLPIMGATVSVQPEGRSTTTDAAGNFLLTNVTAGTNRPIQIDGRTANAPNRTYPVIQEPVPTIVAGQTNNVPWIFFLPPIDRQDEVQIQPNAPTPVINRRVDNLMMTIPANAQLRNRDGSMVDRVSITPLDVDRVPAPIPANLGTSVVYTSQPGGAISANGTKIPVVYPNLGQANPGTQISLWAFNHDTVQWYQYGTGTVSADGKTIAPNIDPSTGHPFGLPDFSWHFPNTTPDGNQNNPPSEPPRPPDEPPCGSSGNSSRIVDYSTGLKVEITSDIAFGGARGTLELKRYFNSDLPSIYCDGNCAFGRGTTHNFNVQLTGTFLLGGAGRVVMPGEGLGRLFGYRRTEPDGSLVFGSIGTAGQLGDGIRKLTDGSFEYRYARGKSMRFNSSRRLISISDRNQNTTTLGYAGNNLTTITDAVGRTITLAYDGSNRISSATDPMGRIWRYTYEGTPGTGGNPGLTTVTDPENTVTRYTYSVGGRLASVTDARGNRVKLVTYDPSGRVINQLFADNSSETYGYTLSGTTVTSVTVTDSLLRRDIKRFNPSGQVIEYVDPLGQTMRYVRDISTNQVTSVSGSCGCTEESKTYDDNGNLLTVTDRLGAVMRYEYEPLFNHVVRVTDKNGHVTNFQYDIRANLISSTNARNEITNYSYDSLGQLTSVTDPLGHTTSFTYDNRGNVAVITDALGHQTNLEYDLVGNITAKTDPLGRRSSYTYDNRNRVLSVTDPNSKTTRFTYDANGNLLSTTNTLNQVTRNTYDVKNRLLTTTDPIENVTRFAYNTDDELTLVRSPLGRRTSYTYDARGQVKTITDALNGRVRFTYDTKGNLTALSDERNNVTAFTYDPLSRLVGRRDPLGKLSTNTFDAQSNLIETVDRLDRHSTFSYDALDRLVHAAYPDATVDYTYDAASRLTQLTDTQGGNIQRTFDNANRLLNETTPAGSVSYSYNNANQRTSMVADNRPAVNYSYDSAGRLQSIAQSGEVFGYSYDDLSRMIRMTRPNGIRTEYGYDNAGRLNRLEHLDGLDQAVEKFLYSYNADSEIETITSLFAPQLLANSRAASPADAANRIGQFGNVSYAFNFEGQTVSKTDPGGVTNYNWDVRGRLTGVGLPSGQNITYSYDALGRRLSRSSGGQTTQFVHDGQDVVRDKNSDTTAVEYVNGAGIDNKLRQAGGNGSLYFLQDLLGSTAALTNVAGGVVERAQYEAFGKTAGSSFTRYGFTGRELENSTGLMFYRARWYDSNQGRFLTEDPSGMSDGANLYHYVINSPLVYRDPLGLVALANLGRAVAGVIGNTLGAIGAGVLIGSTGGAGTVLVGAIGVKSVYGIGANLVNVIQAIRAKDDDAFEKGFSSTGSAFGDIASLLFCRNNQTAQNLATVLDLTVDLGGSRYQKGLTSLSGIPIGPIFEGHVDSLLDALAGLAALDTVVNNPSVQTNVFPYLQ